MTTAQRSNSTRTSIVAESPAGTTPTTPSMLTLEAATTAIEPNTPKAESDTVRNDQNVRSMVPLNRWVAGPITQDLIYPVVNEGLWTEIRAALGAAETAQVTNANTCAILGGQSTITRTVGSFVTDGFAVGDLVKTTGAAAADNRFALVTAFSNSNQTMTVQLPDGSLWSADGANVTVTRGARMPNGTADFAYSAEVAWLDIQKMMVWRGLVYNTMEVGFAMGQKSTIAFGVVGRDGAASAMASSSVGITGAQYAGPATLNPVFSTAQAISVVINGEAYPVESLAVSTSRSCNVRHSTAGGATPDNILSGLLRCKIRLTAFLAITSAISQAIAGTEVPVWVVMQDANGKGVAFSMGTVMWDAAPAPNNGRDQDVKVSLTGSATLNVARGDTLRFQRFQ